MIMKRTASHKVNTGLHIQGNGRSIDVIVRKIEHALDDMGAALEFNGTPNMRCIYMTNLDGLFEIAHGIKIKIEKRNPSNGQVVYISCEVPEGYNVEKRDYLSAS